MDLNLADKVVIVTGADKISSNIVQLLAAEGALPVLIDSNAIPHECEKAVKAIIEKYGRIDGLINNAGFSKIEGLEENNAESFIASLYEDTSPYFLITHYALPALKKAKGVILNISAIKAGARQSSAPAGGLNGLTREWAVELLKHGIRVNALVVTGNLAEVLKETEPKAQPVQNITIAKEIANTAAFLLSSRSGHTTGQIIYVDV